MTYVWIIRVFNLLTNDMIKARIVTNTSHFTETLEYDDLIEQMLNMHYTIAKSWDNIEPLIKTELEEY